MGIQFLETKSQPTMKVLLIVALVIAAAVATPEAEADADAAAYYYGSYMNRGYGWGRGFYGFGGYNRFGGYYGNRWGNYNNYYGRRFYKRSADAEPEAEAAVYYTTAYGYPQYQQYYGLNRFNMYTTGYPSTYTNYQSTYPYASVYGAWPFTTYNFNRYNPMYNTQQVTREAEAEPEAEADADAAYYYSQSFGYPRSYSYGF